jgi:hypothetical protein
MTNTATNRPIETAPVGQNFGWSADIKARTTAALWTGVTRPTGCERAVLGHCEDRAAAMGHGRQQRSLSLRPLGAAPVAAGLRSSCDAGDCEPTRPNGATEWKPEPCA